MNYNEVLDNMRREVAACKSVDDAIKTEESFRSYLDLEARRARKAGRLHEYLPLEYEVRKLISLLRYEWPTQR